MATTYANYLKIEELLKLQQPLSDGPEHDETLFIVIHQVYELWFKQILHEMRLIQKSLDSNARVQATRGLDRVLTILKTLVAQVDVLETMTPLSFNSFRARLESASGFQSVQFRELEFLLGQKQPQRLNHLTGEPKSRLESYLKCDSVYDSFLKFISLNGYTLSSEILNRSRAEPTPANAEVQDVLIQIYRHNPEIQVVCERLVDLDEGLQEWRYRHVKMVERTIGAKIGTGGSAGAEYLKATLFRPLFPDLWEIRSRL